MTRFGAVLLASVFLAAVVQAQSQLVIELPAKSAPPDRALKYTLLPETEELTPGNAASRWRQAAQVFQGSGIKFTEKEEPWLARTGTPLKDLPRKEVRTLLDRAQITLRYADQAARRRDCDWEYPPLTLQTAYELPFAEFQSLRELALVLSLRFRLQLAEKKFDEAVATLQTGFVLGRHVSEGPTIIQSLAGITITSVMLGHVEELMQQPDAPNLYWTLTALPRPFINVRPPFEHESRTFRRSFPKWDDQDSPGMTPEQAQKLIEDVYTVWVKESLYYMFTQNEEEAVIQEKIGKALTVTELLPEAKKSLLAQGRKADEVEAMPPGQIVLTWFVDRMTRESEEILKGATLPSWQALPILDKLEKKRTEAREKVAKGLGLSGDLALGMLSSRRLVFWSASLRTDRWIAGLRAVEAVRLQTTRDDHLPKALKDVTVVPLPLDSLTGQGLDEFYSVVAEKAVLDIPLRPAWDRRYELVPLK